MITQITTGLRRFNDDNNLCNQQLIRVIKLAKSNFMYRKTARCSLLALILLSVIAGGRFAHAQNKVITRSFDWRYKSIPHIDIYYYDAAGENILPYAELYLKQSYDRVTTILPANPKENLPIFIYNTHNEFEQGNIVDIGEGTGGVTEAFKNRLVISHTGSQRALEYLINHEFTHEIEFDYLFSGFWRSVRLLKFIFYPNWLMEGLAEYCTGDIDAATREMYLRDAATSGKLIPIERLHSFNHVLPHQVTLGYKESNALMIYIADEYGADKLPKLLESYRNNFDADSVLYEVLGTNITTLDKRFREYMEEKYAALSIGLKEPSEYGKVLTKAGAYPQFNEDGIFTADGKSMIFISDAKGSKEIYRMELATGKRKRIYSFTTGSRIEYINSGGSALSVTGDGRYLIFCGEEQQKDYIYKYDLVNGKKRKFDPGTDTAGSPVISLDGGTVYFSGMRGGFRDIYSYNLKTGKLIQLTSGPYDEADPVVSPDGKTLVFASERRNQEGRAEYDLTAFDIATGKAVQLTNLAGDERNPSFSPDGRSIYFTSDQDGINDIYSLSVADKSIERITKVIGGNFHPRVSPDGKQLLFSSFRRGELLIYLMDIGDKKLALRQEEINKNSETSDASFVMQSSTAPAAASKKYRFRPGLDLFYPALFYSSVDGLYAATYWQASDFVGDHQLAALASYASGSEYYDYSLVYGFLKYRTQLYLQLNGLEYYWDTAKKIKKIEDSQVVTALYPLNRFQRVELSLSTIFRKERDADLPGWETRLRENTAGAAFVWDVTQGPYLEITSGWGFRLESEFSDKVWGGNYKYQNYALNTWKYFPLGLEHALGWRTFTAESLDEGAGYFYLGGNNRVRGYPSNTDYIGKKIFVNNLEWRFPIVKDLNYHMWYMFPDFFFKTFYGAIWTDAGLAWNDDEELGRMKLESWKGSYGFSLRFHTFILQQYPLLLNLQLARRMDGPAAVLYLSLGSSF